MKILNLIEVPVKGTFKTFHNHQIMIESLSFFSEIPSLKEMKERAEKIADMVVAAEFNAAVIGYHRSGEKAFEGVLTIGAPFFMAHLEQALLKKNILPLYAFEKNKGGEKTLVSPYGQLEETS